MDNERHALDQTRTTSYEQDLIKAKEGRGEASDLLSDLLACPFCGETPDYPGGDGTQYEIECDCGMAMSSVQISDLMTIEERIDDDFTDYRYGEIYIERAKAEATKMWNTRAS